MNSDLFKSFDLNYYLGVIFIRVDNHYLPTYNKIKKVEEIHVKKLLSILMGLGLILILVGCSSQETATFTQKSTNVEFFVTYTYDKKNDTVTKLKIEMNESAESALSLKGNEKLSGEVKKNGVVVSIKEKDGKRISLIEIDLTKTTLSSLKESGNVSFPALVSEGFLVEDGDHASFSKSKEVMLQLGFTELKK